MADASNHAMSTNGPGHSFEQSAVREEWIARQMDKYKRKFTEMRPINVYAATWNVNGKKPSEPLHAWLIREDLPPADVYCIGLQEIVDLNAASLLVEHNSSAPWLQLIKTCIAKVNGHKYQMLVCKHLVGIMLTVWVRKDLYSDVSQTSWNTCGVGVMGVGGNKGAVGVRFRLFDTSICIVCAHMAAHKNNVQGRNADFHNISERLQFSSSEHGAATRILEHDYVFWIGDLNYRLRLSDIDDVHEHLARGSIAYLLEQDQLVHEQQSGRVFSSYTEPPITFPPTYKFQPGTDRYESRPEKKKRMPAWCDRVLFAGQDCRVRDYFSAPLSMSDHKPVACMVTIPARAIVKERQQQLYRKLLKKFDDWENEQIPKVTITPSQLQCGTLYYDTPITQDICIENTGTANAKFRFVPKQHEVTFCKPWVDVEPRSGIIAPGESIQVHITLLVKGKAAADLNMGLEQAEDILIVRLENGIDYFLGISGEYQRSSFGCPIDFLVRLRVPVLKYTNESDLATEEDEFLNIPKEVWWLVDAMQKKRPHFDNLDEVDMSECESIRYALDTGLNLPPSASFQSLLSVLLSFLQALPVPLFPQSLCARYEESLDLSKWCRKALVKIPITHYNLFIYIISFTRHLLVSDAEGDVLDTLRMAPPLVSLIT